MEDVAVSGPLPLGRVPQARRRGGHRRPREDHRAVGRRHRERRGRDAPRAHAPGRRRRWRGRPGVPRVVVSGLRLVNFRSYCDATVRVRAGSQRRRRRERDRQDEPARGRLVRAARELAAHAPRREAHHVGRALRARGADAREPGRGRAAGRRGVRAQPGQARALGRARGHVARRPARPQPGVHLRAREPAAGEGQPGAAARPPGRVRLRARPAVRRRRPRAAGRAAPAQRPARRREARRRPRRARPVGRSSSRGSPRRWGAAAATSSRSSSAGYAETAAALAPAGERFALQLVAQLDGRGLRRGGAPR